MAYIAQPCRHLKEEGIGITEDKYSDLSQEDINHIVMRAKQDHGFKEMGQVMFGYLRYEEPPAQKKMWDHQTQTLVKAYQQAGTLQTRQQILSHFADNYSKQDLQELIPGLSKWRTDQARAHSAETGPGKPVQQQQQITRLNPVKTDHFLAFHTQPHLQDCGKTLECLFPGTRESVEAEREDMASKIRQVKMLMGDADGTTTKDMMTALLDHYLYTKERSTSSSTTWSPIVPQYQGRRQDLSPADILVNSDDIQDLQDRFTQKVKTVLVEHFQSLEKFKDTFRKPSSPFPVKKSVVIPLPLEDKDEYKKADTIEILLTFARELNLRDCMKDQNCCAWPSITTSISTRTPTPGTSTNWTGHGSIRSSRVLTTTMSQGPGGLYYPMARPGITSPLDRPVSAWPIGKAGQKGGGAVIPCKIRVQVKDKGKTLAALMAAFSDFGPEKTVLTLL
ncbi:hypothetical protein Bbelb_290310 [Branchiostoma belcheri]|nr:hypothetical protein Bbelb_290310 [Branchiostoma belcheri]